MVLTPRLSSIARYVCSFVLHFAHGSLVMAGLMVVGLIGYQVSHYGAEGLNPKQLLGGLAEDADVATQPAAVFEEPAAEEIAQAQEQGLTPGLVRVSQAIAKRHKVSMKVVENLVKAAQREGQSNGLDPLLILAVVTVESGFNPYAESTFGAQGLMQVIPRFHQDRITPEKGAVALFDPEENIRVGTEILKHYLRMTGSIEAALQVYAGASADPEMSYSSRVNAELQRLKQAANSGAGGVKPVARIVAQASVEPSPELP